MFGSASQGGKQTDQPDRLPVECCRIFTRLFIKSNNFEQLHAPDGEKRGGADAGTSLAPLVMPALWFHESSLNMADCVDLKDRWHLFSLNSLIYICNLFVSSYNYRLWQEIIICNGL